MTRWIADSETLGGRGLCVLSKHQRQVYMATHFAFSLSHTPGSIIKGFAAENRQTSRKRATLLLWPASLHSQPSNRPCIYTGTGQLPQCPLSSSPLFIMLAWLDCVSTWWSLTQTGIFSTANSWLQQVGYLAFGMSHCYSSLVIT